MDRLERHTAHSNLCFFPRIELFGLCLSRKLNIFGVKQATQKGDQILSRLRTWGHLLNILGIL